MSAHTAGHSAAAQQLGRAVRLFVFTLGSAAIASPLVHVWVLRYPLLGLLLASLEVTWRAAFPVSRVSPAPAVDAVLAPPDKSGAP